MSQINLNIVLILNICIIILLIIHRIYKIATNKKEKIVSDVNKTISYIEYSDNIIVIPKQVYIDLLIIKLVYFEKILKDLIYLYKDNTSIQWHREQISELKKEIKTLTDNNHGK